MRRNYLFSLVRERGGELLGLSFLAPPPPARSFTTLALFIISAKLYTKTTTALVSVVKALIRYIHTYTAAEQ